MWMEAGAFQFRRWKEIFISLVVLMTFHGADYFVMDDVNIRHSNIVNFSLKEMAVID